MFGKKLKKGKGNHPPIKRITFSELINIILAYSPIKKKAKPTEEYSTLYPDTSSASASGKSKGCLFVSATEEIKKSIKIGKKGKINQIFCCAKIISVKFNEPTGIIIVKMIILIETS